MAKYGRYVQTLRETFCTFQNFYYLNRETRTSEISVHIGQGWGATHFRRI